MGKAEWKKQSETRVSHAKDSERQVISCVAEEKGKVAGYRFGEFMRANPHFSHAP